MRLICPNCDAQYEVADEVIPADGRDVQCSNCSKTWFQESAAQQRAAAARSGLDPEHLAGVPDAEIEDVAEEVAPPSPPPYRRRSRPPVPDEVSDILREEAEAEARAREAEATQIESQPDLGIEEAPAQRRRSVQLEEEADALPADVQGAVAQLVSSNRDLLPDIEEINSTLTAETVRKEEERATNQVDTGTLARRRKLGFRLGFGLVAMIAIAGVIAYVMAPMLAQQYPEAEAPLAAYVAGTDALRVWLDGWVTQSLRGLTEMMSSAVADA